MKLVLLALLLACCPLQTKGQLAQVSLSSPQLTTNRSYRFNLQIAIGQTYPVAVSDDMIHWTPWTNVSGRTGNFWVQDDKATNFARRFYHVGVHPTPITNMVFIYPGTFTMGSPPSEAGRNVNEGPQTVVTLTRGFWMGKYEVTQSEYTSITGSNAFFYIHPATPADFVTWPNATNYCRMLTDRERASGRLPAGFVYRLPTEAEWEYACRAGTTTPFGFGASLSSYQANFDGGFPYGGAIMGPFINRPLIFGLFAPNAWGLHDMHGNVWEWVLDVSGPYPGGSVTNPVGTGSGTGRILRGGGSTSIGNSLRSARRDIRSTTYSNFSQGFRVVLALES